MNKNPSSIIYAKNFEKYCNQSRWASYWHQIKNILKCQPRKVLEIGVGDEVLSHYLKKNIGVDYFCVDIMSELGPDFINSVDNLKDIKEDFADVVCAFEVLEHLPFEKFPQALTELYRVSSKFVIISLPHWGRHFSLEIKLPHFKRIRWQYKFNIFNIEHKFDGHHYWEIGKKGYPLKAIKREILAAGFKILDDYLVFESPYHHFFILRK